MIFDTSSRVFIQGKMFLTLHSIISCLCNLVYSAQSWFTSIDILKPHQGYLFRVKFSGPGLQHLLSFQPGLTREFALFIMRIFLNKCENLLQSRAFTLQKMFLTLNFIISCLCNLGYPANSLFAFIDILKPRHGYLFRVKFPGPTLQYCLFNLV